MNGAENLPVPQRLIKVSNLTYFSFFEIKDLIGFPSMTLKKCVIAVGVNGEKGKQEVTKGGAPTG